MTYNQKPIYKPQVACPSCGELSAIDYCKKDYQYTWWCSNEKCGKQYSFVIKDDWSVESEPTGVVVERELVLLEMKPQKESVFIVVKAIVADEVRYHEYFYNEHSCPVNYFNQTEEVSLGEYEDPHGLFRYVKSLR